MTSSRYPASFLGWYYPSGGVRTVYEWRYWLLKPEECKGLVKVSLFSDDATDKCMMCKGQTLRIPAL